VRYRTKIDTWIVVVLVVSVGIPIAIGIFGYVRVGAGLAWLPLSIAVLVVIIICVVAVPTTYEVTQDQLVIRSGVLRWLVPLAEIVSITPTSKPLSGPAWSLDRLEVKLTQAGRSSSILISPQRTEDFLREIASQDVGLIVENGMLRRAGRD